MKLLIVFQLPASSSAHIFSRRLTRLTHELVKFENEAWESTSKYRAALISPSIEWKLRCNFIFIFRSTRTQPPASEVENFPLPMSDVRSFFFFVSGRACRSGKLISKFTVRRMTLDRLCMCHGVKHESIEA